MGLLLLGSRCIAAAVAGRQLSGRSTAWRGYAAPAAASSKGGSGRQFDSNRLVERLETQGFSKQQSEAIVVSVTDVLQESTHSILSNIVTKAEQDKTLYMYKVDFAQLKSEIQMMEKTDFSMMKAENERLQGEVNKLKQKLREEITRTQAGVRLDMSLEKGRARDEQAVHEIKIRETDAKIEQEISALRTQMESIKFSILQYMIGTITGTGALILAYLRMFK
ncbi:Protein fmp32, mitochondrial [Coemansia sp. RSA 1200]|nr:Protein fmp32, mitochondrial [Coemansia sp. RSA 1200]